MMKFNSLKKFIANKIITFVERSLDEQDFVKKRTENSTFDLIDVFKKNQNKELKKIEKILIEHVHNLDEIYVRKKNDLNEHYYLLQNAFNDYVKHRDIFIETKKPDYVESLEEKIRFLESKISVMFFDGKDFKRG